MSRYFKSSWISLHLTKSSFAPCWYSGWNQDLPLGQENKKESMLWRSASSRSSREFNTEPSAGKIMVPILWNSKAKLLIYYMPPKTVVNVQYNANLLLKLRHAIKEKQRQMLTLGFWLLQDNILQYQVYDCPASCIRLQLYIIKSSRTYWCPDFPKLAGVLKSEILSSWCLLSRQWSAQGDYWRLVGGQTEKLNFKDINSPLEECQKCNEPYVGYARK